MHDRWAHQTTRADADDAFRTHEGRLNSVAKESALRRKGDGFIAMNRAVSPRRWRRRAANVSDAARRSPIVQSEIRRPIEPDPAAADVQGIGIAAQRDLGPGLRCN